MAAEDVFVNCAASVFELFDSLNSIEVFGLGAATWIYVIVILSLILVVLELFLPGIIRGGSDDDQRKGARK